MYLRNSTPADADEKTCDAPAPVAWEEIVGRSAKVRADSATVRAASKDLIAAVKAALQHLQLLQRESVLLLMPEIAIPR